MVPTIRTPLLYDSRGAMREGLRDGGFRGGGVARREPGRVPPTRSDGAGDARACFTTRVGTFAWRSSNPARRGGDGECPPLDECLTETPGSLARFFPVVGLTPRRVGRAARRGDGIREKSQVAMASMTRMVEQGDRVEAWWAAPMADARRRFPRAFYDALAEMIKHIGALAAVKERDSAGTLFRAHRHARSADAHDAAAAAAPRARTVRSGKTAGRAAARGSRIPRPPRRSRGESPPRRFQTSPHERWTRVGLLIRAATASKSAASRHPAPLARLFLAFDSPKPDGTRRAGKAWRAGLREWLKLMKDALTGGRQVRGLENGVGDAVRASLERHVSADEPDLARLSLKCLGQWRMPHLTPENADRLCRVADVATMKDELTTLHVEDGGEGIVAAVRPEHRFAFASLVVRCLLPRLKRRSGRYAPLRAAALSWIGRLDAREITPLVYAAVGPLEPVAAGIEGEWADALVATASGDATTRGVAVRNGARRARGKSRSRGGADDRRGTFARRAICSRRWANTSGRTSTRSSRSRSSYSRRRPNSAKPPPRRRRRKRRVRWTTTRREEEEKEEERTRMRTKTMMRTTRTTRRRTRTPPPPTMT